MSVFNHRKKALLLPGLAFIIIFILVSIGSCDFQTVSRFEEMREQMGTYVNIIVYSDEETAEKAISAAFDRIEEIEDIATIFNENSEASFLNNNGYIDDPSEELDELISESIKYYKLSGGSFDITISPVLKLWSEGLWMEPEEDQAKKIAGALKLVGSDKIIVTENRIELKTEGMAVDFGGIAKGYAVDEALKVIEESGISSALVNAGGDLSVIGSKPGGEKWQVELEDPDDTGDSGRKVETLPTFIFADKAVATSGNYYRYYDPEKEVHHISDPKTGYTADSCISVTIIADDCITADVLATSVFVMGPEEGLELVESLEGVEAFIIDAGGNIHQSSGISDYFE